MTQHKVSVSFEISTYVDVNETLVDLNDVIKQVENNIIKSLQSAIKGSTYHTGVKDHSVVFRSLQGGFVKTSYGCVSEPTLKLIEGIPT